MLSSMFSGLLEIQSDLAYPVLVYPDPSPSGRKSVATDLQHMPCTHTVCVFDYPVPSPIRIFFWKTDVCGYVRSDCIHVDIFPPASAHSALRNVLAAGARWWLKEL